jgi:hypothetical protein
MEAVAEFLLLGCLLQLARFMLAVKNKLNYRLNRGLRN